MKSESQVVDKKKVIKPYEVTQAIVGLELGPLDRRVLNYLDFFFGLIPTKAAHFIHVLPKFNLFNVGPDVKEVPIVKSVEINEEISNQMKSTIEKRLGKRKLIELGFDVKEGDPLEELLKDAEQMKADLVVIGQRSGRGHHGILAKNLVRKFSGNALVVPQKAGIKLRRILVPIDFSENSIRALKTAVALRLQSETPAEIFCLNVYDMPNFSTYRITRTRAQFKKMMEEDRIAAFQMFLDQHIPEYQAQVKTDLKEKEDPGVAHYLMDYANDKDMDLIAIGAKGHSKVELLLLGSVTERLLSINDHIPILVVK